MALGEGTNLPNDLISFAVEATRRLDNCREIAAIAKGGRNYRTHGLDRRKMREALQISPYGLTWLIENGHIPPPDCLVPSYEWRSAGKYTVPVDDEGWSPEVADKVVSNAERLREVYADRRRAGKSTQ